jgi:hypothetical protein
MARTNWLTIFGWVALVGSILFAVIVGWWQLDRLKQTKARSDLVEQQRVYQQQQMQALQSEFKPLATRIAVPDRPEEDARFVQEIQALMLRASVTQLRVSRPPINIIPPLVSATPTNGQGSQNTASPPANPNQPAGPSILNLPLGLQARSVAVEVQGSYPNIRAFFGLVRNYRREVRAININSFTIQGENEKGQARAQLVLTRFVRPENMVIPGLEPGTEPVSGETLPNGATAEGKASAESASGQPAGKGSAVTATPPR